MDGYDYVNELIVQNPKISAATLLNMLKSKGVTIGVPEAEQEAREEKDTEEADSASSNAPSQAAGVKKESSPIRFLAARLLEKDAKDDGIGPTKFRTVLIEEGLGNFRDRFFYTKEALQSAVPIFEGKKIYADHPSSIEEQSRPERSVKDVLGYFENVALEEDDSGRAMLTADVQLLDDMEYAWARGLMRHAVNYAKKFPDKEFVGLSINASGDAEEKALDDYLTESEIPPSVMPKIEAAKAEGIDTIKVVSRITNAVSCDLVTEAGAGGKVLQMLEQERNMAKANPKESEMKQKQADDKHDDEKQDVALFKKLAAKMGKDGQMDEGDEAMAKDALEMAHAEGLEGEEALKCAEYGMKMMKHSAAKKKKEAEAEEAEEKAKEAEETKEAESEESECMDKKEAKESEEKAYESLRQQLLTIKGENAKLKEALTKIEVEKYLDEKMAKSGLPMAVTKAFKESLGAVKSVKDIDRAFDVFKKGYEARGEASDFGPLVLSTEKVVRESSSEGSAFSLTDCVR